MTYNNWHLTEDLLRSIHRITYPNWEIVIVDNGSSDSIRRFNHPISRRNIFEIKQEFRVSGGNNFGMEKCDGDFVLFINNDVEVESDL